MNVQSLFLLYVSVFRLAIIAVGALSILLGYRLFRVGVFSECDRVGATSIEAAFAGHRLTLKNAAPGTGFGLFGVIIIAIMLFQGSPELTLKTLSKVSSGDKTESATEVKMRGTLPQVSSKFEESVDRGMEYDKDGDVSNAITSYENAVVFVSNPLNQLAWDYLQQGRTEDAIPMARLAVQLCPREAAFVDTLAEALAKAGQQQEALKWTARAASLDPKYKSRLLELEHSNTH